MGRVGGLATPELTGTVGCHTLAES